MLISDIDTKTIVKRIKDHVKTHAALISIAEKTPVNIPDLISKLNTDGVKFMGGIFPKVIHDSNLYDKGLVINTLVNCELIYVTENISSKTYHIPEIILNENENYSLITYIDGLTSGISHYLSKIYQTYGMQTNYFGGGAGSLTLVPQKCVFSNGGFFKDAAATAIIKMHSNIGVKHGWKRVDGPFIVTKAEGNIIKELNWQNPFEIYKTVVEQHALPKFDDNNFFDIAKGYPFGIVKDDAESIVRDPLNVNANGELICVGELENNMLVNILNGNKESLVQAASNAAIEALSKSSKPNKAIIIDCISRILFLEDDFQSELDTITKTIRSKFNKISISGALTLGEISSYGEGYLEFYNKTVVIGLFE